MTHIQLAEWLHDNYEQLAKAEKWQTQEITRVKFDDLPNENKRTMIALADLMTKTFKIISLNPRVIKSVCEHHEDYYFQDEDGGTHCLECGEEI